MKYLFLICLFALLLFYSCFLPKEVVLGGSIFETHKKDAFGSSKLILRKDSTFMFYGQGPSVLLSTGIWGYDVVKGELSFRSDIPGNRFIHPTTIDTFWIDISTRKGRLIRKDKIIIDDIIYYKTE